jgi:hypothetical protein
MTNISMIGARISLATATLFSAILLAMHILRPDLDPSWRFISEYELGPFGWLMHVAFIALAMSCASLCVAIFPYSRTVRGWLGMLLLMVSCGGMVLAGVYPPDKDNKLHEIGAVLDSVPFAAILLNWSLYRHPAWSSAKKLLAWTAALSLLGLVAFIGSLALMLPTNGGQPGPTVLAGWPNRFFVLAHIGWLAPIAWHSLTISAAHLHAESQPNRGESPDGNSARTDGPFEKQQPLER